MLFVLFLSSAITMVGSIVAYILIGWLMGTIVMLVGLMIIAVVLVSAIFKSNQMSKSAVNK